jgi:hypothetical protein
MSVFQPLRLLTDTLSIYFDLLGIPAISFNFFSSLLSTEAIYLMGILAEPQLISTALPLSKIVITS